SVVLGYAEILLLDKSLDDSVTEKIKAVKEHADRIKKLIIQMTDISQVKTKSYILGSEILDIQNSSDPEAVMKKSILIVDKSKDNGLQYSSTLLNDGYNANYAKDKEKAKTLIKNNYYPIIIMDNTIFSNNLIGSIKVIHQIYKDEKIILPETILIHDEDFNKNNNELSELDINKTLKKPVSSRELLEAVRAAEMRYCNKD
ncbi:MAG: hypothetical protein GY863_22145, partial [bacterium]|nr:hypothetical protein [bacterium]